MWMCFTVVYRPLWVHFTKQSFEGSTVLVFFGNFSFLLGHSLPPNHFKFALMVAYHQINFGGERAYSKPNHVLGDPIAFKASPAPWLVHSPYCFTTSSTTVLQTICLVSLIVIVCARDGNRTRL